jgi:hypothetical protein
MHRTKIIRRMLEFIIMGERPGCSRTRWFSQVLEDIRKKRKSWREIEKEDYGKIEEIEDS